MVPFFDFLWIQGSLSPSSLNPKPSTPNPKAFALVANPKKCALIRTWLLGYPVDAAFRGARSPGVWYFLGLSYSCTYNS